MNPDYKQENIGTKLQLKKWFEKAIEKAQNPSPRVKMLKIRKQKIKKVEKQYGL